MRALIIEDNKELCEYMKLSLLDDNYAVDTSYTGVEGEEKGYVNSYDVILLDLNLPDKDGLKILDFWRKEGITTPVIIITARDELKQRAEGLDMGADDYIAKPVELMEVKARIRAVVRRFHGRSNPIIKIGNLSINPKTQKAEYLGTPIDLSVKEFEILEVIASRHPEIVSSEEIAEHIYDESFEVFSSVLRVHISRLRKKLSSVCDTEILCTVRGKGYYLCEK